MTTTHDVYDWKHDNGLFRLEEEPMKGETKMTTQKQHTPTDSLTTPTHKDAVGPLARYDRPPRLRYNVTMLARNAGIVLPLMLSPGVWKVCVHDPARADAKDMAACLEDLLWKLRRVLAVQDAMEQDLIYHALTAAPDDVPPPVKLTSVLEETFGDLMTATVYLADEAEDSLYITHVYGDGHGSLVLASRGKCQPLMLTEVE